MQFKTRPNLLGMILLACVGAKAQVATTTSLILTQAGAPISSVAPVTPVTLTATVLKGGVSVSPGQVTFCDAATVYCTDIHALGTVQLSSSGIAKLTLLPGAAGTHHYQAKFLGTTGLAASASAIAQVTVVPVVTPAGTSVTSLVASGVPGNYTLTATVTDTGIPAPSGVVSFADATNSGYVLVAATLGVAATGLSYTMGASYPTGTSVDETAVGDFNGDGFPDIVTMNGLGSGSITVLMNKGDGTFAVMPSIPGTTDEPGALAVGDFDGDGNLDIAIGDVFKGMLTILLGNGDGTFRQGATTVLPAYPSNYAVGIYAIGVGDFNQDGIADLAVVDPWSQTLRVLLGVGDGTFALQPAHPATGVNPLDIAVGDFNGDGKLDLIVCNAFPPGYSLTAPTTLSAFLGDGDGTFTQAADISVSAGAEQIFAADFDGDGKLDLAINHDAAQSGTVVEVLSGNGDGTFTSRSTPQTYVYLSGIGIGDLNGDGRPDFGGAFDQATNNVAGLIGDSAGTFTETQWGTDSWQIPNGAVVADFKGVGYGEIAIANQQNGVTVMEPHWTGTATATITAISPVGTGTHYAYAIYSGDANYSGSTSNQVPLTAERIMTALSLTANSSASTVGQSVTLTATLDKWNTQNHTATQSVTFLSNGVSVGFAPVSSGVATLAVSTLAAGTDTLTASYAGDTNFAPSASGNVSHTVTSQTVTATTSVTAVSTPYASIAPIAVTATENGSAGSADGSVVSFSVSGGANGGFSPSSCILSAGSCSVQYIPSGMLPVGTYPGAIFATFSAVGNYFGASIANSLTITGGSPQTITFPQPSQTPYAGTTFGLGATSSSGLPITYTVISGPATVSGGLITYTAPGVIVVEADQSGNSNYSPAQPVQITAVALLLTEPVGTTSPDIFTYITVTNAGTVGKIAFLTQGAPNLDFNDPPRANCAAGTTVIAGQACLISFTFKPTRPGLRYGGITLTDASGNVLANSLIYGIGIGPMVTYSPGKQGSAGTGLVEPSGVAVDGHGNLFVAGYGSVGLQEISTAGVITTIGQFNTVDDVAVDGLGNVFLANNRTTVSEVLAVDGTIPANPTILTLATSFISLNGIKVDANGDVFLANGDSSGSTGAIYELPAVNSVIPANPTINTVYSFHGVPTGVAIDSAGDLFYSDGINQSVNEILAVNGLIPASPTVRTLGSGFGQLANIALDDADNVFTVDYTNHVVWELLAVNGSVPATNPTIRKLGTGFSVPSGIFIDGAGTVYVADESIPDIVTIDTIDPPVLNFATTYVGATSTDSPKTITVFNDGNAPLVYTPPGSGPNPTITPGFTLGASSTCPQPTSGSIAATLAAGASCTDIVSFTPIATGLDSGKLITADNHLNVAIATQTVLLNGTGKVIPPATITLTGSPNPVFLYNPISLTANINSSAGTPTGTVQFFDGTTSLGIFPLVGSNATLTTSTLTLGSHIITAVYSGDTTFAQQTSPILVVLVEDFSFVITNPTLTIKHGGTAVYNFVVTTIGGTNMAANIGLTIAGSPDHSPVTFSPTSILTGSGTTSGTLTIVTPDYPVGPFSSLHDAHRGPRIVLALTLFGAMLLPFSKRRRDLNKRVVNLARLLLFFAALTALTSITGCADTWGPQHYPITVTATSGALSHTATAILTSQP